MIKRYILLVCAIIFITGCANSHKTSERDNLLRHVVLFAFKADASPQQIKAIEDSFIDMVSRIDEIQDFEWGTHSTADKRNRDFTHCYILKFRTEAELRKYQANPIHEKLRDQSLHCVEKILVVDYWKNTCE